MQRAGAARGTGRAVLLREDLWTAYLERTFLCSTSESAAPPGTPAASSQAKPSPSPRDAATAALVREGIAAVVEAAAEEDFEAAHAEEDKLRARVLRAIAGGRCDDPETCARLALSTSVVAFTRHCA
jgi:hypothetical protein